MIEHDTLTLQLIESVARMEGKLDATLPAITDHENRLRKLERHRWLQVGAGGLLGTLGALWAQYGGGLPR